MKVLKWLFNFANQYRNDRRRYEKSGIGGKITVLVLHMGFVALSIWLELFTFDLFSKHFGWAIVSSIFTVAIIVATVKSCGTYCAIAFLNIPRMSAKKKVDDLVVHSLEEGIKNIVDVPASEVDATAQNEQTEIEEAKKLKSNKTVDIVCGIIYGICSAGLLISSIVLLFLALQMKI